MTFEEVLPALKEGKKIRRKDIVWENNYGFIFIKNSKIIFIKGSEIIFHSFDNKKYVLDEEDLNADDWEIVNKKKKVKLRDLTPEQFKKWKERNCEGDKCKDCVFNQNKVNCIYVAYCWIKDKSIFSDKFLDQEIEIED